MPQELWDVLDGEGQPIGSTDVRGAPDWPEGHFHLVVATCAYAPDGRVLLTQRAAEKEFPLTWEFPGGSAFAGETSAQAVAREFREENRSTSAQLPPSTCATNKGRNGHSDRSCPLPRRWSPTTTTPH